MPLLGSSKFPLVLRTRTVAEAAAILPRLHALDARAVLAVDPERPPDLAQAHQVLAEGGRLPSGKIGPSDPCPCGSGRKFKDCCIRQVADRLPRWRPSARPGVPAGVKIGHSVTDRHPAERANAAMQRSLAHHEFGSLEEVNAFLARHGGPDGLPPAKPETPAERAQELVYDAWEARTPKARAKLADKALAVDPACADAWTLLAEERAGSAAEALELCERAVAAAEQGLDGHEGRSWWRDLATRPYMRARACHARALWALGRHDDAIAELVQLLKLNRGDNQGLRYWLAPWLIVAGKLVEARTLLAAYSEDERADWVYFATLLAFAGEGPTPYATRLLAEALATNAHVPASLTGRRRLPDHLPEVSGPGDENEATACAMLQLEAWHAVPGARAWLAGHDGA